MLQSPPAAAAERKKRTSKQAAAADAESEVDSETQHRSDAAADHSVTITCPCDDQHNSVSFLSLYLPTHKFIKKGAGKPTRFFCIKMCLLH